MIQIGKIVHKENLHDHKPLPYILYQNLSITPKVPLIAVPTLTIGWKLANELFPGKNLDILERKISLNRPEAHFWEFSPVEDIVQYSAGIDLFVRRLPHLFISKFKYKNTDPFFHNLYTTDQINQFFPDGGDLYVYKNEMAYYRVDDTIYGLKLAIYDYLLADSQTILSVLVAKSKNHILDDSTEFQKYYRMFPEFGFLKRSMVVFLFP